MIKSKHAAIPLKCLIPLYNKTSYAPVKTCSCFWLCSCVFVCVYGAHLVWLCLDISYLFCLCCCIVRALCCGLHCNYSHLNMLCMCTERRLFI